MTAAVRPLSAAAPAPRPRGKIPCLDGLRAVSIGLVVVAHAAHAGETTLAGRILLNLFGNGGLGVEVFFVISGFLITTLLVREREARGRIDLKAFYVRRVFRIFPALYAYVLVVVLACAVTPLSVPPGDFVRALTFTWNYSTTASSWTLAHTWSLSVEEQFYLLWPFALAVTLAWRGRLAAAWVAFGLVVAAPGLRLLTWAAGHPDYAHRLMFSMLHTRIDALMVGCLVALLWGTPLLERLLAVAGRGWPVFAGILVASPYLTQRLGGAWIYVAGYSLEGVSIAMLMLWLIRNPGSRVGRVLESRPLVHLGCLSYSLYLWQELFLDPGNVSWTGRAPVNLLLALAMAELSYQVVEKGFLRLRERWFGDRVAGPAAAVTRP